MSPRVAHVTTGNTLQEWVPDGYHMRTEAAELAGLNNQTLKRWHRKGIFVAEHYMERGDLHVWLYTDADIETLKEVAKTVKPGRPPATPAHVRKPGQKKPRSEQSKSTRPKYTKKKRKKVAA